MIRPVQYVRYTLRQIRKSPGFTTVAVLTLALGIGATAAMYTVLYATILAPMPYPHPEQLVMVWSKTANGRNVVSAGDFLDWKRQSSVFQDLQAWSEDEFNLATADHPEEVLGHLTTPGWFKMQGFQFFLGRDFLPEEGELGKDHEVILSHRLWERLGSDRNIIGQPIRLNREPYTVVGVLTSGVADRLPVALTVPLAFKPEHLNHNRRWLPVMGRLKPGISLAEAQSEMNVVAQGIARDHPESNKDWGVSVEPLRNDFIPRETLLMLRLLMGAVGFVLLIACANLANLLLAKATARLKEVAIRASLGASRHELFTQFMTESLFLALLGGAAGVGFAQILIKAFNAIIPANTLPSEADISISIPVLLFTLTATTFAAVLFGCAPAWQASGIDPNNALKEGGAAGTSASRQRLRRILVVSEFALALVLLSSAGLAIHSFRNLTQVDLGIRRDHVLTFGLPVPEGKFRQPEEMVSFYRQLLLKIESIPGVARAQASTGIPVVGVGGAPFEIVGRPEAEPSLRPRAGFQMITPGYFETFGVRLLQGRNFTEQDISGGLPVAMVNENFVRRYLSGADPLTQRIAVEEPRSRGAVPAFVGGTRVIGNTVIVERQIVGVYHNVRNRRLRNEDAPEIDIPFYQSPSPEAAIAVRTSGDPAAMTKSIAAVVASMDRDLPITDVRTMDQIVNQSLASDQFQTILYVTFAAFALLLAAVGIYGVMAFAVAQRTHEIGLRMALGAARQTVVALILKEGMLLALTGSALGLAGALFVGRAMKSMLYGVGAIDLTAFGAVAIVLLAAALAACLIPARRAAKVDPMVALRYE
jgi:putative ABC transport system permease protein